jgi:hypothetical protein
VIRPPVKHGRITEDNIKADLRQVVCKDIDWIDMAQAEVK